MSTLSSLGIGSGLDINGIVNKLMSVESQPLFDLQSQAQKIQTQASLLGQVKSAYAQLQSALQAFSSDSAKTSLLGLNVSSSDSTVASASISGSVPPGSYALNVSALASSQQLVSNSGQASSSAALTSSAGSITIQLGQITGGSFNSTTGAYTGASFAPTAGSSATLSINAGASLNDIRDAINKSSLGVQASVIFDGASYRLSLASPSLGAKQSLSISATGDAALQALMTQDPTATQNFKETKTASDLSATLNGIAITSSSNSLSSNIPGLSISAFKTGFTSLNVSQSASVAASLINPVISAWNSLNSLTRQLTAYDPATKKAGGLNGDSLVRGSLSSLRSAIFGAQASGSSASANYTTLMSIGVSVDSKGVASLDSSKLQAALNADPSSVSKLLLPSGANLLGNALTSLNSLVGAGGFQSRIDSLNSKLSANQKQQDALSTRLDAIQKQLTAQYTSLDVAVSQMQNLSNSLSASWTNISKNA